MKFKKLILTIVATVSLNVQAGGYIGGQYTNIDYAAPIETMKPKALSFIGGKSFNDWFSIEARLGLNVGDDTAIFNGLKADPYLDRLYGAYGRFAFLKE